MNSTATAVVPSDQQVSGQSLFWAIVALGLAAMAQPPLVAGKKISWDNGDDDEDENEGMILAPQASSPVFCLMDALLEAFMFVRYALSWSSKFRPPNDDTAEHRDSSSLGNPLLDRRTSSDDSKRKMILRMGVVRTVLFFLTVVPQTVKVLSMHGIPMTQIIVFSFFATIVCRMVCDFAGQRLNGEKVKLRAHLRRKIGKAQSTRLVFEAGALAVHSVSCLVVWCRITRTIDVAEIQGLVRLARLIEGCIRRLTIYFFPLIFLRSVTSLMQPQWTPSWSVPNLLTELLLACVPLNIVTAGLNHVVRNAQESSQPVSWYSRSGNNACAGLVLMASAEFLSLRLAALVTVGVGRLSRRREHDAIDAPSNAVSEPIGDGSAEYNRHNWDSSRVSLDMTLMDRVLDPTLDGPGGTQGFGPTESETEIAITWEEATSLIGMVGHTIIVHSDEIFSHEPYAALSRGYAKRPWSIWTLVLFCLHGFYKFNLLAFRSTWRPSAGHVRALSFPSKICLSATILCWIVAFHLATLLSLVAALALELPPLNYVWYTMTVLRTPEVAIEFPPFNHVAHRSHSVIAHVDDDVWWIAFAIFNLATSAIYYLVEFDGTGTVNRGWTSWLG